MIWCKLSTEFPKFKKLPSSSAQLYSRNGNWTEYRCTCSSDTGKLEVSWGSAKGKAARDNFTACRGLEWTERRIFSGGRDNEEMTHSELMTEEEEMVDYNKLLAHYMTSDFGETGLHNQCCETPGFCLIYFFCLRIYGSNIIPDSNMSCNSWGNSEPKTAKQCQQNNYLWLSNNDSGFYRLPYIAVSLCEW
jgi:hypothetical protein